MVSTANDFSHLVKPVDLVETYTNNPVERDQYCLDSNLLYLMH